MLFLLPEVEHKVENERQHYSPVGFSKPEYHGLVDSDDQKCNCKRKDKNVGEFHVYAKIAIIWVLGRHDSLDPSGP